MKVKNLVNCFLGLSVVGMMSCSSAKVAQKVMPDEVEISVHCSGPDFWSTEGMIRANNIGESLNMAISKKKARSNTLQELASKIETTIKAVVDNYQKSVNNAMSEDIEQRYEELARETINQKINGYKTICEKVTRTSKGSYKTYLAFELPVDNVLKDLHNKISSDEKLKIDYDYEKFKKTFDNEMKKMENQR